MARIEASTVIKAPVERVWEVLIDWEAQPRWMVDARSVTVLSSHREGLDVVLSCRTVIAGGLVVTDDMVTTAWSEHSTVGVRHLGRLIRGIGAFDLESTPEGTRFVWWEELDPPLGAVGELVAGAVVVPLTARVFRSSLARLKALCEAGE
ncbi:MAG: SRPBCC family protein [Egibacteraceae bacterium]